MTNITQVITYINDKAIASGLKYMPIKRYEYTPNGKVKIIDSRGFCENFGSVSDCIYTLDAKYNLKLFNTQNTHQKLFENKIQKVDTKNFLLNLIDILDSFVDQDEKMMSNLRLLKNFLHHEIKNSRFKSYNEAYKSIREIYKKRYLSNKAMFLYIDTINQVFQDHFV